MKIFGKFWKILKILKYVPDVCISYKSSKNINISTCILIMWNIFNVYDHTPKIKKSLFWEGPFSYLSEFCLMPANHWKSSEYEKIGHVNLTHQNISSTHLLLLALQTNYRKSDFCLIPLYFSFEIFENFEIFWKFKCVPDGCISYKKFKIVNILTSILMK